MYVCPLLSLLCNHCMHKATSVCVDWIGLDSLFIQGKPLANGYYTRHPVKCTVDRNETKQKNCINRVHVGLCQCMIGWSKGHKK